MVRGWNVGMKMIWCRMQQQSSSNQQNLFHQLFFSILGNVCQAKKNFRNLTPRWKFYFRRISKLEIRLSQNWTCLIETPVGSSPKIPGWKISLKTLITLAQTTYHKCIDHCLLFCSTSLPLASTRWVQSTFSSLCPFSSKQRRRLTRSSNIKNIFPRNISQKNLGMPRPRFEPWAAGWEARTLPLCYAAPHTTAYFANI